VFKCSPSIPKKGPYKKMVQCPAAMPVALRSAVHRRRPKRCRTYKKVECPAAMLVALSTTVCRAKRRVARLCRLLMSANKRFLYV